jgi:hypothetical protein
MRRFLCTIAIATVVVGCRQSVEPPGDVTISLTVNPTQASRGDTVSFTINAAGNNLFGVVVEYGDSFSDEYSTGGALTARVTFKHAYDSAGTFTVRAVVTDALAGEKQATTSIVVN